MESISHIVETINNCLWGLPMILLLSGTHLFMTWKTGFIQKKLPLAIRLSLAKDPNSDGDISPLPLFPPPSPPPSEQEIS